MPRVGLALDRAGFGAIVTAIAPLCVFHRAGEYRQDHRKKHPVGECSLRPTGVPYPVRKSLPEEGR